MRGHNKLSTIGIGLLIVKLCYVIGKDNQPYQKVYMNKGELYWLGAKYCQWFAKI